MPIHISEKKRGSETFRKSWIGNLNGTLDGELEKYQQRLESMGCRHHKKYKAFKWHRLNANGSLMVCKSEINGQETVQCKYHC